MLHVLCFMGMVDVNLLPDELRGREAAERKRLFKTPKVVTLKLTDPGRPEASTLQHGGAGMGRPVTPRPGPLPAPEPPLPPLPSPMLPRPERLVVERGRWLRPTPGMAAPSASGAAALPPPPSPPVSVSPVREREAALLAAAVRREVEAAHRARAGSHAITVAARKPRWTVGQWMRALFSRGAAVAPKSAVAVPPLVKPHGLSPPLPAPLEVKVAVMPPVPPRLPRPRLPRWRFWYWLRRLIARRAVKARPPLVVPRLERAVPPAPKPAVPAVKIILSPQARPRDKRPKMLRKTLWQWLMAKFSRRPQAVRLPRAYGPKPVLEPRLSGVKPVIRVTSAAPMTPILQPTVQTVTPPPPTVVVAPRPPAGVALPAAVKPTPPVPPLPPPKPPAKPAAGRPVEKSSKTLAINLIPEEYARHPELNLSRKFLLYLAAVGVSVFAVLTLHQLVGWYDYLIGNQIEREEQRIKILVEQIEQYRGLVHEATVVQRDLDTLQQLLERHRYWTKVFAALEQSTIDDVYFTTFASSADGSLMLNARGRDYRSVARQLVAFRAAADTIAWVSITGATALADRDTKQITQVDFSVALRLRPEVLLEPLTKIP